MFEEELNEQFAQIEKECYSRMKKGFIKYGAFNPRTYDKDLVQEAKEELFDCINYCKMLCIRLDQLQTKLKKK